MRTRVWTVTCPECKLEMYSRARHDCRVCGCPFEAIVDGGFSGYVRYGGKDVLLLRKSFRYRYVKFSQRELYEDWSQGINHHGVYKKPAQADSDGAHGSSGARGRKVLPLSRKPQLRRRRQK